MADSWTEMGWIADSLGHNGPAAQIREYNRQIQWLKGGHRERLERELREIPDKIRALEEKCRKLR